MVFPVPLGMAEAEEPGVDAGAPDEPALPESAADEPADVDESAEAAGLLELSALDVLELLVVEVELLTGVVDDEQAERATRPVASTAVMRRRYERDMNTPQEWAKGGRTVVNP